MLATVGVAQLMIMLDMTIVNIALPTAQKALGFSDGDRQWVVTAYALAFGGLLLLGGRLGDLIGRRAVFMIGLIGFASASAYGGLAANFAHLVAARACQGMFAALLAPAALSVLTTTFTRPKERALAFGVFGGIAGAGGAAGLLLGGFLTDVLSWRWTLFVNVIFAIIALSGALAFLRQGRSAERQRLDLIGALFGGTGLFALVYGFSRAAPDGWGAPQTWIPIVAAVWLLLAFVGRMRHTPYPLLPLRVVADRNRGASFLGVMIIAAAMFAAFLFGTYYLQNNLGYTAIGTGLAFLPQIAVLAVTAQVTTNFLLPRFGPKVMVPLGMVFAALGMGTMGLIQAGSTYTSHVLPGLMVMGLGMGMVMPSCIQTATLGIDAAHAGVGSAVVNTSQQIGGAVGTAILNTIATRTGASWLAAHGTEFGAAWGKGPEGVAYGARFLSQQGIDPAAATAAQLAQAQQAVIEAAKQAVAQQAALESYTRAFWIAAGMFLFGAVVTAWLFRRRDLATAAALQAAVT